MNIELREVQTNDQLNQFVNFPFTLYKNNPHWIPPIKGMELFLLDKKRNPAFDHSEALLMLAFRGKKVVGRIACIINYLELEKLQAKHARFGWLDFIDDVKVCHALFFAIEKWALEKGMETLKGPYGFTNLDKSGMLVKGFESLGTIATLYNYDYYPRHMEKLGFEKEVDWVEVDIVAPKKVPERLQRFVKTFQKRYGLRVLRVRNRKELKKYIRKLFDLLVDTYKDLHGFVPLTESQIEVYMSQYLPFIRKDFVCIVLDKEDEMIGFGITMPSLSKAMQRAGGKLFPFGIFHLLYARTFNDTLDLVLIGVKSSWRNKGVNALIFNEIETSFIRAGINRILVNPMLENNAQVLTLWKDYKFDVYKRRRAFTKKLSK